MCSETRFLISCLSWTFFFFMSSSGPLASRSTFNTRWIPSYLILPPCCRPQSQFSVLAQILTVSTFPSWTGYLLSRTFLPKLVRKDLVKTSQNHKSNCYPDVMLDTRPPLCFSFSQVRKTLYVPSRCVLKIHSKRFYLILGSPLCGWQMGHNYPILYIRRLRFRKLSLTT